MDILKNAIDSISLGLEDFRKSKSDPKRLISCARNLYAGVLLLFKQKLVELSPKDSDEILIKREFRPAIGHSGVVRLMGFGKKTVDYVQIKERLSTLGISVDWKRMYKIREFRNEVEHYHSRLNEKTARGLISDVFLIVRNFIKLHLGKDPARLLKPKDWQTLLDAHDVYKKEKKSCVSRIQKLTWHYDQLREAMLEFRCESCGSGLISPKGKGHDASDIDYVCRSCGRECGFEDIAEAAIVEFYANENHLAMKDGGYPVTIQCMECMRDTYHLIEDVCLVCGESVPRECKRCGDEIPLEEISGEPYCGYCLHVMNKED